MENEMKIRSNVQDMVKGALIIAVVFFHSTLFGNALSYNEFNIVFCIFPCLMGVFFFYAGYNYTAGKRTPLENIKRRTKQLLIPLVIMIFVAIILVGGLQLLYKQTDLTGIWHSFKQFLLSEGGVECWHPDISKANFDLALSIGVLWYLYTLYIISVIFYLIVDKVIKKLSIFIPLVGILVILSFVIGEFIGPKLPYAVQSWPLMLALVLTGAYLSQKKILERPLDNKKSIVIAIIQMIIGEGIIFGLSLLCYFGFGATTVGSLPGGALNNVIKGFDAFVVYVMALFGTILIHTIMRLLNKIKVFSIIFGFIGKNVSLVYVTHPIFLSFIHTVIFGRNFTILGGFQSYAYTLLTLVLFAIIRLSVNLIIKKIKAKKISEESADI